MSAVSTGVCRKRFILLLLCALVLPACSYYQTSDWHKDRLLQRMVDGTERERTEAALGLIKLKGQRQLLLGLRARSESTRELARLALTELWERNSGVRAYEKLHHAVEFYDVDSKQAHRLLSDLVYDQPDFAEAWAHKAFLELQMDKSQMAAISARRAIELNSQHFRAWRLLGVASLMNGHVEGASLAFRKSLLLDPHDQSSEEFLETCQQLRRMAPPQRRLDVFQI
jgi:cytochrome c-type biogenesis protein CcmH/NrfG